MCLSGETNRDAHIIRLMLKPTEVKESKGKERLIIFDQTSHCLQSYDPQSDKVTKFHDGKPNPLMRLTAATTVSFIYILFANKSVFGLNFKEKNSQWEKIMDTIVGHGDRPPVIVFSGLIYVIGHSFGNPTKDVEILNPDVNRWTKLKNIPKGVSAHVLVSLDDSIYSIGGWDGTQSVASFRKFTPLTHEWKDLDPMTSLRPNGHRCHE